MWAVAAAIYQGYTAYEQGQAGKRAAQENAAYYREQGEFAARVRDRQAEVFARDEQINFSEQQSAFARAGVDVTNSAMFLASEIVSSQKEANAIKLEGDQNVRLAMLRANQSDREAADQAKAQQWALIGAGVDATTAYYSRKAD